MSKRGREIFGVVLGFLASVVGLAGADITPGYTWVPADTVTHTKLNTFGAGSINTTFYSTKSSAGANPNSAWQVLLRNTSGDVFVRSTLAEAVFDHTGLLSGRALYTTPIGADTLLIFDSAGGAYKQIRLTNLFFGAAIFSGVVTNEDSIPFLDASTATPGRITVSNLFAGLTEFTTLGPFNVGDETVPIVTQSREVGRLKLREMIFGAGVGAGSGTGIPTGNEWIATASASDVAYAKYQLWSILAGTTATALEPTNTIGFADGTQVKSITYDNLKSNIQPAYVLVRSEQTSGTSEGLTNVWSARKLNTEVEDFWGIASVANNAVTLQAGIYRFRIVAPAHQVGVHQCMLTNETAGIVQALGMTVRSGTGDTTTTVSECAGRFTNLVSTVYGVRHRCTTSNTTDGGGLASGWGTEVYTTVEFWRDTP